MSFKMGETCDGCDAIVKNLKKIAVPHKGKYEIDAKKETQGMKDFMEDAVENATAASTKVVNKINKAGKSYKIRK
jgi:hypothetical protein